MCCRKSIFNNIVLSIVQKHHRIRVHIGTRVINKQHYFKTTISTPRAMDNSYIILYNLVVILISRYERDKYR